MNGGPYNCRDSPDIEGATDTERTVAAIFMLTDWAAAGQAGRPVGELAIPWQSKLNEVNLNVTLLPELHTTHTAHTQLVWAPRQRCRACLPAVGAVVAYLWISTARTPCQPHTTPPRQQPSGPAVTASDLSPGRPLAPACPWLIADC